MSVVDISQAVFLGNMQTVLVLIACYGAACWIQLSLDLFSDWSYNRKKKKESKNVS